MTDTRTLIPQSDTAPRCWALIPCAGAGSRAGAVGPKQYQLLAGQPMVLHTLAAFAAVPRIARTLVVVAPDDTFFATQALDDTHVLIAYCGGSTRATSVLNGLNVLLGHDAARHDWVLVHDAARPCLPRQDLANLIRETGDDRVGGILALPVAETVKRVVRDETQTDEASRLRIAGTEDRSQLWLAQTPQMFRCALLMEALRTAGTAVTDEAGAVEQMGLRPRLVTGSRENIKVTFAEDLKIAAEILARR